VPFGGFGTASWAPALGAQNEPLARYPCGQEPPGPVGFGQGIGAATAPLPIVAMISAISMRMLAVFIGRL